MSRAQFRRYGKETVDYVADYLENIHKRRVVPAIEPGYLKVFYRTFADPRKLQAINQPSISNGTKEPVWFLCDDFAAFYNRNRF